MIEKEQVPWQETRDQMAVQKFKGVGIAIDF